MTRALLRSVAIWVAWLALVLAVLVGLGAVLAVTLGVPRESWATPHGLTVGAGLALLLVVVVVVVCGLLGGLAVALWDVGAALWRRVRGARWA